MGIISTYADVIKDLIFTLGRTYTINPVQDAGFSIARFDHYDQYDYRGGSSNKYSISDSEAFAIVPITNNTGLTSDTYYTYQITPRKTGVYTFSQYVWRSNNGVGSTITYSITVVDVTSITLPSPYIMLKGETKTLTPIIIDSRATTSLTWQSSNPVIATISQSGEITALEVGNTTITCINSNGVSAQCVVTVNPVSVTNITLNKSDAELSVGDQLQLSTTVKPTNASDKSVTWSSSNEAVAVVNESGKVYAVGTGFSQIKAKANDGSNKTASCMVTVKDNTVLKGDVNGDGEVTVTDAEEVIDIILNKN